ncbi:hypothetical protein OROHE_022512 [Orobanche hederae]
MSWQRVLIHHSGHWERSEYVDGDSFFVFIDTSKVSRANLVGLIREGLSGPNDSDYKLWYLTHMANGNKIKVLLRGDIEILRLLVEYKEDPEVYVENGSSSTPEVNLGCSTSRVEPDNINYEMPSQDYQYEEAEEVAEDEEVEEVLLGVCPRMPLRG